MSVARINVISTHINSICGSIMFSFWLLRILLDSGLPYAVVVMARYWQRSADNTQHLLFYLSVYSIAFVCYFAMRSFNRLVKITFLLHFDWMNSLAEHWVSSAALLLTGLSVTGKSSSSLTLVTMGNYNTMNLPRFST